MDVGGAVYREFLLDVNQKSSQPYLSLDELRLYTGATPNLAGYDPATQTLAGQSSIYDLGPNNWVKLDARLTHGSGSGDMYLFVPDYAFTHGDASANPYVYLYSKFGVKVAGDGGYEEWAPAASTPVTGVIGGTVNCTDGSPEADVMVFLDANHNGLVDADEVYTYTDGSGKYAFNDLAVGLGDYSTYWVTAVPPSDASSTQNIVKTIALTVTTTLVNNVNFVVDCPIAVSAS